LTPSNIPPGFWQKAVLGEIMVERDVCEFFINIGS